LLPHAASPNYLRYARVITNPHVALHSPHNFNRPDGNYVSFAGPLTGNFTDVTFFSESS
jgi:hypothetical protein